MVASALLVDYVLTVAVSVSAGVDNIISARARAGRPPGASLALGFVVFLTAMNLRGVKESGKRLRRPDVLFVVGVVHDDRLRACSSALIGDAPAGRERRLTAVEAEQDAAGRPRVRVPGAARVLLRLHRADRRGGDRQRRAGVPQAQEQERRHDAGADGRHRHHDVRRHHGARACITDVRYTEDPASLQSASTFGDGDVAAHASSRRSRPRSSATAAAGFFYIQATAAALILILAANTAFNGFPLLGSILAQDRYLPRQLHTRGDRLVFSNGILLLAGVRRAADRRLRRERHPPDPALHHRRLHLVHARPDRHGPALEPGICAPSADPARRGADAPVAGRSTPSARSSPAWSWSSCTITKFTPRRLARARRRCRSCTRSMRGIRRHYDAGRAELRRRAATTRWCRCRPANHAIVLVSKMHNPTLRALAYARATRPDTPGGLTVDGRPRRDAGRSATSGSGAASPVPLKVLDSPYREITRPVIDYVRGIRRDEPARRRHGLHPRVRRRPLVGAAAAQPERAAAQGPAAVHPGRDGDQRAVAAARRPRRPCGGTTPDQRPATSAAARSCPPGGTTGPHRSNHQLTGCPP